MNCAHCNGTGSRSKELHGLLDCTCSVADERIALAAQARAWITEYNPMDRLWLAYQQGKAAAGATNSN